MLTYVNSDTPSRKLSFKLPQDVQIIPIELNLRKRKWLIISIYRPQKQNIRYFLEHLSSMLDFFWKIYEYSVIMGDFNLEPSNNLMKVFFEDLDLYNLMKTKTCFNPIHTAFCRFKKTGGGVQSTTPP